MASIPLRQTVAIARFLRIPMTNSKFNTTLRSKFKIPVNFNVRQMSNSQHRVILVPEVPKDTAETNPVMQKCTDTSWPKFDEMTMDNFYYGLGKTLLEYETSVLEFEEKCAQGVMDFDELFQNIEAATCQFEYTWSLVGLFSFISSRLDHFDTFIKLSARAERAFMTKYDSNIIYEHLKRMQTEHAKTPYLNDEQEHIIHNYLTEFKMQGFGLPELKQRELRENWKIVLRKSLADYNERMARNNERFQHTMSNPKLFQDFPVDVLKEMAQDPDQPSKGPWTISLHPYLYKNFMAYMPDRLQRFNAHLGSVTRGGAAVDRNTAVFVYAREIRTARKDIATTMGYKSFPEMSMENKMADSEESVRSMLDNLADKAKQRQEMELQTLQSYAKSKGFDSDLEIYDVEYWVRRQRNSILGVSDDDLRNFFPLPKVLEGIQTLFEELFNVKIHLVQEDHSKWNENVTLHSVENIQTGKTLGHFYLDPYIRDDKAYAGADKGWYFPLKNRSKFGSTDVLGTLVFALPQQNYGKPPLLNFNETKEVLRNFGKMLQHMLTENEYSETCGQASIEKDARDFVQEFITELIYIPDVLRLMSSHYMTQEPLKQEIVDNLCKDMKHHMAGYYLCHELFMAEFDLGFHTITKRSTFDDVYANVKPKYLLLPDVKEDEAPVYYEDIIGGKAAGSRYCPIWNRMLAADAFYAIIEAAEGSTSKQPVYQLPEVKLVANQFHKIFLTKGGGSPMTEMFRQFRGRNPTHEALLYSLGLKKSKSFV